MTTMTSRERVLAAIAHEEPDRVPIILGTNMNTSIVHQAYDRLKALLGVESETEFLYFKPNPWEPFALTKPSCNVWVVTRGDCRSSTASSP